MTWYQLFSKGIDVGNIARNSEEYDIMFSAAIAKDPSAQYCLGLWAEQVNQHPQIALLWLRKAEQQGFQAAKKEIRRIENDLYIASSETREDQRDHIIANTGTSENDDSESSPTKLVIREHDFREAINSLQKYTEQTQKDVRISRVRQNDGPFNWRIHKVTGEEINEVISQIQTCIIDLKSLGQGFVAEFGQVYNAFNSLDRDYISGIVASIKAAEKVSKDEQKDRADIKKLVEQHELSVKVLKKFKADLDNLKSLTNKEFPEYMADLSKVQHLKDVDIIYVDLEKLKEDLATVTDLQTKYANTLHSVRDYCDVLSRLQHILDIDELWTITESVREEVQNIKKSLEDQIHAVAGLRTLIQQMQETQQQFEKKINKQVQEHAEEQAAKLDSMDRHYAEAVETLATEQKTKLGSIEKKQKEELNKLFECQSSTLEQIANDHALKLQQINQSLEEEKSNLNKQIEVANKRFKEFTETQANKLDSMDRHYSEAVEALAAEQNKKLVSVEENLRNSLDSTEQKHQSAINQIENAQKAKFEELFECQSSTLEQIANDHALKLQQINQSLEEEKSSLNRQVSELTQKVKILYLVAGSAAALTVIQLLLNILGVF